MKQEIVEGFCRHRKNKTTFYGPDTENLSITVIKLILKISMISHMSEFYLLWGGGGGAKVLPPKKNVFPEKKLKAISNTDLI